MPDTQHLKVHIVSALDVLPTESLILLADLVTFLLAKLQIPTLFEQTTQLDTIPQLLSQLNHNEQLHLEQEFSDYDRLYPTE